MTASSALPDSRGHFGAFGGRFVPETLIPALDELSAEYARAQADPAFAEERERLLARLRSEVPPPRRAAEPQGDSGRSSA